MNKDSEKRFTGNIPLSPVIYPAVILLGFVLYGNTFAVPFLFDDRARIVENAAIKIESFAHIGKIINLLKESRPVTLLTFSLNYYFHRFHLSGYHLFNIFLHVGCGMLIYLFLCRLLMQSRYREKKEAVAAFAALLFTAHPVQTQAVTYLIQRATVLSTFFYLSSLLFFIMGREKRRLMYYVFSLITGVLAVASKQIAITLPIIIVLYDYYFYRDRFNTSHKPVFYIILLILPFILAVVFTRLDLIEWLKNQYQKRPFTPYQRLLTEFRVVAHYLTLLVLPLPGRLNIDHHFTLSTSFWNPPATFFAGSFLFALLGTGLALVRRKPVISFFILWFLINISLESSILGLELIFEHRLYLPSVAFFALMGMFVFGSSCRVETARMVWPAGILLLFFYGWGTIVRNRVWGTELTLWQDAARKSPDKPRVLYNLGRALADKGRYEEALPLYRKAVHLQPVISAYYNNLGSVYGELGNHMEAIGNYRQGLRLDPRNPRLYNNLGNAYKNLGRYGEALAAYRRALSFNPGDYRVLGNVGVIFYHQEKYDAAIVVYKRVLKEHPQYAAIYRNLALVYQKQKVGDEALQILDAGIQAVPSSAELLFSRGKIHWENQAPSKALDDFLSSKILNPESWEIRNTLGIFYKNNGDYLNAAAELETAVRLRPEIFISRFNLAFAYKALRQYETARNIYLSLLEEKHDFASIYYNLGNISIDEKDYQEAIKWFEKAWQKNPKSREFAHNLALARLQAGDLDGAEEGLSAVIGIDGDYLLARENLALLYLKRKNQQKAVPIFEFLLEKDFHRVSVLNHLGMIFYKNPGEEDRALEYFRLSLLEAPHQPEADKIESLISKLEKEDTL